MAESIRKAISVRIEGIKRKLESGAKALSTTLVQTLPNRCRRHRAGSVHGLCKFAGDSGIPSSQVAPTQTGVVVRTPPHCEEAVEHRNASKTGPHPWNLSPSLNCSPPAEAAAMGAPAAPFHGLRGGARTGAAARRAADRADGRGDRRRHQRRHHPHAAHRSTSPRRRSSAA